MRLAYFEHARQPRIKLKRSRKLQSHAAKVSKRTRLWRTERRGIQILRSRTAGLIEVNRVRQKQVWPRILDVAETYIDSARRPAGARRGSQRNRTSGIDV